MIGARNRIREYVTMNPGTEGGGGLTVIGDDGLFMAGAHVAHDCRLGDRVILHAGTSIGHDGFGHATHKGADGVAVHHKIPQVGNAVLEDDVRASRQRILDSPYIPDKDSVRGFVFDVATGRLSEVA